MEEKEVSYISRNTYAVLNELTPETSHVWIVFHGMGYLSKYFLRYFEGLDPASHYLISPQAPSKYYLNNQFKHVGACWLTKENTLVETDNILSYLDALMAQLSIPEKVKLVIFGYSQGVSIALRWVARSRIPCHDLILYAGGVPNELRPGDLSHLRESTRVRVIFGDKDEYLTPDRWKEEQVKIDRLFQGKAIIQSFEGEHEIKKDIINSLP